MTRALPRLIARLRRPAPPRPALPASLAVEIGGAAVEVALRVNPRARAYTLRLKPPAHDPVLTLPANGTLGQARAFLDRHRDWLGRHLAAKPAVVAFAPGALVPLRGVPHRLVASGRLRGTVIAGLAEDGPILTVPGDAGTIDRRVGDFLRKAARADLEAAVARHAATLGKRPRKLTLRDTVSRWGSCSAAGDLSFSWRLILAPAFVLDYLAAHEVAHLAEMNHGPAFWRQCVRLCPRTEEARAWLKANGAALHRYGA